MKYLILLALAGCTDATLKKITQLGGSQEITCYSGGVIIYHGISTGKVMSEEKSDGYYFEDKATGKIIEISADCVMKGI